MIKFYKILMSLGMILLPHTLYAYSDSDFDGVSDEKDFCANSSFEDIVDKYGCAKAKNMTLLLSQEQSSGTYGGTDLLTSNRSTVYAAYTHGYWNLSASTFYSSSTVGVDSISGQGDVYITAGYSGLGGKKRLISLQTSVKVATADAGIGTGANDYNIRLSTVTIGKSSNILFNVGYTFTGDTATTSYDNILNVSAGLGKQMSKNFYSSLSGNYISPFSSGSSAGLSLSLYGAYTFSNDMFVTGSYIKGFTDAVADNTFSVSIGQRF